MQNNNNHTSGTVSNVGTVAHIGTVSNVGTVSLPTTSPAPERRSTRLLSAPGRCLADGCHYVGRFIEGLCPDHTHDTPRRRVVVFDTVD